MRRVAGLLRTKGRPSQDAQAAKSRRPTACLHPAPGQTHCIAYPHAGWANERAAAQRGADGDGLNSSVSSRLRQPKRSVVAGRGVSYGGARDLASFREGLRGLLAGVDRSVANAFGYGASWEELIMRHADFILLVQ